MCDDVTIGGASICRGVDPNGIYILIRPENTPERADPSILCEGC